MDYFYILPTSPTPFIYIVTLYNNLYYVIQKFEDINI